MDRLQTYKRFPGYITTREPTLEQVRLFLVRSGLLVVSLVVSLDRLRPTAPSASFGSQLIELCCDNGLETVGDMILFEGERLGIESIATMDGELQRASADFEFYSWF